MTINTRTVPTTTDRSKGRRSRRLGTATIAALSVTVLLAACGGGDDETTDTAATASTAATAGTTDAPAGDTGSDSPETTEAGAADTPGTTSAAGDAPADGGSDVFSSDDGNMSMSISPDWTKGPAQAGVSAYWFTSEGTTPSNVNVVSQAATIDNLEDFVEASTTEVEAAGLEVIDSAIQEGANGQQLGVLTYQGTLPQSAGQELKFRQVLTTGESNAAIATFTTTVDLFDSEVDAVMEYLLTLEAK